MRGLWAVVLVAAVALGDDGPPAQRTYGIDEWSEAVAVIERSDALSIAKAEALRKLTAGAVIERRAKILDIAENGAGRTLFLCDVFGGEWRGQIDLPAAAAPVVATWGRWDRVTLTYTATVGAGGGVGLTRAAVTASSLRRVPNPGPEFPPEPDGIADDSKFRAWLAGYGRRAIDRQWSGAATAIEDAISKTWRLQARVVAGCGTDGSFRATVVGDTVYREKVALTDGTYSWTGRAWGFDGTLGLQCTDPQVTPLIVAGAEVTAFLTLDGGMPRTARDLRDSDGELHWTVRLGRVAVPKKK